MNYGVNIMIFDKEKSQASIKADKAKNWHEYYLAMKDWWWYHIMQEKEKSKLRSKYNETTQIFNNRCYINIHSNLLDGIYNIWETDMNIKDVKNSPLAIGRKELIARMNGKHLTTKQSILAKCYECNNGYIDGKNDCKIEDCALYEYMPFGKIKYKSEAKIAIGKKNASVSKFFKQNQ